jgi:CHAT domain-containing protein
MSALALLLTLTLPAAASLDSDRQKAWKLTQDESPEASSAWERVADEAGRTGDRCLEATALFDVGVIAAKAGDKARAKAFFEKALPIHEALLLNLHSEELDVAWANFEYLCPGEGPAKDAEEAACLKRKHAFAARRRAVYETEESSHTDAARDLLTLAENEELAGRVSQAVEFLRKALLEAGYSSSQTAAAALALAEAELRLGQPAAAEDDLYRASEGFTAVSANRADWLRLAGDFRRAGSWRGAAGAYWRAARAGAGGASLQGCSSTLPARERIACLAEAAAAEARRCDPAAAWQFARQAVSAASAAHEWGLEVQVRQTLARQFCILKDYPDCARAMELVARRAAATGNPEAQAEALLVFAVTRAAMGQNEESRAAALQARAIYVSLNNFAGKHTALLALADIASQRGDYGEALKDLDAAILEDTPTDKEPTGHIAKRSRIKAIIGDFSGAIADSRWLLDISVKHKDRVLARDAHRMIAAALDDLGDEETALEEAETAVAMGREIGDKESLGEALNIKGIVEMNLALTDKAFVEPAISDLKEAYRLTKSNGALVNLGDAYWAAGRVDDADKQWEEAGHQIGRTSVLYAKGRYQEAIAANLKLYAEFERRRDYGGMTFTQTQLGQDYEALGRFDEAATAYARAREVQEEAREALSEGERLHFIAGNDWQILRLEPLEGLVRVLDHTAAGPAAAFAAAEYTRSRLFAEASARRYGAPETRLPTAAAREESMLVGALAEASKARQKAYADADVAGFEREDAALRKLRGRQAALIERLRAEYPEYAAAVYPKPVSAAAVPLRADEALIEFEVTAPYTKAFVVRGGKVVSVYEARLSRQELSDLVARYTGYFEKVSGSEELAAFDGALSHKLYAALLEPALRTLPAGTKIIIAPDEALAMLPFESLVSALPERLQSPAGKHGPAPVGLRYVADDWDVAYVQSASALAFSRASRKRAAPKKSLLVVADPVFGPADPRARPGGGEAAPIEVAQAVLRRMGISGTRSGETSRREIGRDTSLFPRLDATAALAQRLVKRVFAGADAEALTGWDARASELRSRRLSDYRYLVFATHGILDGDVPKLHEPALVLTQLGLKKGESGFLTMSDVLSLRLSAELVALTACRTGVGRRRMGEGVMGLGRAFQLAGARNTLVSLWSVSEESTSLFAERLFIHLREGKTPRESHRLARADLRREGYEHPFYWAPFALYTE